MRFTRDWGRVRCVDPEVDIAMLEALEADIRGRLEGADEGARPMLSVMEETFSGMVQVTAAQGCEPENLATGMEQLMRLYVEPRKREAVSRATGRQSIYGTMRTQFERAGVWDLMRKRIAAASYTQPGDPLKIDCGYRPNGVIRMFQAVSLDGDLEMAKVLAFSVAGIREGVRRVDGAELELTAVVEPLGAWEEKLAGKAAGKSGRNLGRKSGLGAGLGAGRGAEGETGGPVDADRLSQYRFAVETMERGAIRVATTSDLPRLAEAARRELRV